MANIPVFHSIKTLAFDIFNESPARPDEVINYGTSALFGVSKDLENKDVKFVIRYSVLMTNIPGPGVEAIAYGRIVTESLFAIPEIESFFNEPFGYQIPKEIVIPLLEAACSTTRGVALIRGAGTQLDTMPIPLISGASILERVRTVDVPVPQKEAIEAGLVTA